MADYEIWGPVEQELAAMATCGRCSKPDIMLEALRMFKLLQQQVLSGHTELTSRNPTTGGSERLGLTPSLQNLAR